MQDNEKAMIDKLNESLRALLNGEFSVIAFPNGSKEFEKTFELIGELNAYLRGVTELANQIAGGDYRQDLSPLSPKDPLSTALGKVSTTLMEIVHFSKTIASGAILDPSIQLKNKDDLLGTSMNEMVGMFKDVVRQIYKVTQGDYRADTGPRSERDMLGTALEAMTLSLRQTADVAQAVAVGNLGKTVEVKGEHDVLANSINYMIGSLKDITSRVNEIITGDNSVDIKLRSEDDELGIALQKMEADRVVVKAEAKFRAMVASVIDPIISIDEMGLIESVNPAFTNMFGYGPEEVIGKNVRMLMPEPYSSEHDGYLVNYRQTGIRKIIGLGRELTAQRKSGETIPIHLSVSEYTEGAQRHFTGVVRDLTIVRNAEQKVQQQSMIREGQMGLYASIRGELNVEELAGNVLAHLVAYLGANMAAFYAREEDGLFKRISGYAYGKSSDDFNRIEPGEGLVGQVALDRKILLLNSLPPGYVKIKSGLGGMTPNSLIIVPILFAEQTVAVLELAGFKAFTELEERFLKDVAESIGIAFNAAQNRAVSRRLLEETQNQAEELQAQQEELRASNESLGKQTLQLKASEKSLKVITEELRASNNELAEKSSALEIEKNKLELASQELEAKSEDLALASKYKSEFLANMSHELRTPLNSMLLLSSLLAKNKEGNLTTEQVESATVVYKGGVDLLELINEILDLSKVEAGMMKLEPAPVFLEELVESLERNFKFMMQDKGLKFIINTEPGLPQTIISDQKRLEQILKNLMSNAIKFTSEGNITVFFSIAKAGLNFFRSGLIPENTLSITVTDTGIGIPPEKQKLIFEAFQQAESGSSKKYSGTGLGLSISRELANLLGGEIQLESKQGSGSSFSVYLPLSLGEQPGEYTSPGVGTQIPKAGVQKVEVKPPILQPEFKILDDRERLHESDKMIFLLIEDDLNFAKILVEHCHTRGSYCLATPSGEEGLLMAEEFLPSGIILDISLSGVDGWYVLNTLKENPKTRHIPVQIITVADEIRDAESRGAIGFINKPVNQEGLDKAFQTLESFSNKKVKDLLIVEDDESTMIAIKKYIGNGDVKITEAGDGAAGFEHLLRGNFDCVIMDLSLPGMSGSEILEKLVLERNLRLPPIIIYTGTDLSKDEQQELLKYANSIIIKGVDSIERLFDETSLFLHRVIESLPEKKQKLIQELYDLKSVFKDKKILVVDDDMRNVFALAQLLEENGTQVLKAEDGLVALELLKQNPDVNLVLMDIMMPGMDGYETTRKIREQNQFKKLPIIALTAKAMLEDRKKCIDAGASDYLAKPVEEYRLLSMMRIWLYNEQRQGS